MKGFYLYCIRNAKQGEKLSIKGLDSKSLIFIVPYQDLEAVVSKINFKKPKEDDLKWIVKYGGRHEKIIEKIMEQGPVIPMKFCSIFNSQKKIEDLLKKNYQRFAGIIKKIANKEEWGLKIYLKKIDIPEKSDYFKEVEAKEKFEQITEKKANQIFKKLKGLAQEAKENKLIEDSMMLNSVYLIEKSRRKEFIKKIRELKKANPCFEFVFTGPWPCYNFV